MNPKDFQKIARSIRDLGFDDLELTLLISLSNDAWVYFAAAGPDDETPLAGRLAGLFMTIHEELVEEAHERHLEGIEQSVADFRDQMDQFFSAEDD